MNNRGSRVVNSTTPGHNKAQAQSTNTSVSDKKDLHAASTAPRKAYRPYRRVTAEAVSRFVASKAIHGNGTQAVRELEPDITDASRRAWLLSSKANELNVSDYIEAKVSAIAVQAVDRLKELVLSDDEQIATKNVHYTLDRQGGKAIQRSESKTITLNIDAILG